MNKQMKKQGKQDTNSTDFCTVWKMDAGDVICFETKGSYTIDWGDGCTEQVKDDWNKHTYVKKGEYTVSMSSTIKRFSMTFTSRNKLIEIKQWGTAQWEDMSSMFKGAWRMICTATDTPNTSKVKSMSTMFSNCWKFNAPIEHWDTSCVTDINGMLFNALMFNRSLAKMDLSSVEDASCMLSYTPAFNQDLRDLNIGAKANTRDLFGRNKSLAQYNLEQAERYATEDEKQDVYSVLDG